MKILITEGQLGMLVGYLNEGKYSPKDLGPFIYHETNYRNAINILKEGFKSGRELMKGEKENGIFFSATDRGQENTAYNRGKSNKRVRIEVSTDGLNLLDTGKLPVDPELHDFQQQWYLTVRNVAENNIFPEGYDGILHRSTYSGGIYQIILKKEVATKHMTGRIKNLRGKYIEI
jgi:hypothetical protein